MRWSPAFASLAVLSAISSAALADPAAGADFVWALELKGAPAGRLSYARYGVLEVEGTTTTRRGLAPVVTVVGNFPLQAADASLSKQNALMIGSGAAMSPAVLAWIQECLKAARDPKATCGRDGAVVAYDAQGKEAMRAIFLGASIRDVQLFARADPSDATSAAAVFRLTLEAASLAKGIGYGHPLPPAPGQPASIAKANVKVLGAGKALDAAAFDNLRLFLRPTPRFEWVDGGVGGGEATFHLPAGARPRIGSTKLAFDFRDDAGKPLCTVSFDQAIVYVGGYDPKVVTVAIDAETFALKCAR